ncbi:hypothetical protein [Carboxydothermus ferrireducens]|uniref:Lipoprotein n=1 Tax=Carboxydothermus ferrireducens DSM 11255 TaxID=1119529 RepID=A0ABX2RDC9_9THEO|nr:hypothetical protein [Carboxydothermus ferrireducens]NYE58612.1 hypothetical protein [Carboxydothermus ferrireducens DSM 11255]
MWVIEKRAYYFFVVLILLSLITGCTETENTTKKPVTDNRTVKNKVYKDDKSESPELSDLEKNLKELATRYILAKYKGDENTLLKITKENAYKEVISGELKLFKEHKFEKIVSFKFQKSNIKEEKEIIVAVSSIAPGAPTSTIYYERICFKKIGDKWFITKVLRDA